MRRFLIFYTKQMLAFRLYLIKKLISNDLKVMSNIKVTSDILRYNNGMHILQHVNVKIVSAKQSFVYSSELYTCTKTNSNRVNKLR